MSEPVKVAPWTVEQSLTMRVNTTLMGEAFDNVADGALSIDPHREIFASLTQRSAL
jgi:hypothetical protein